MKYILLTLFSISAANAALSPEALSAKVDECLDAFDAADEVACLKRQCKIERLEYACDELSERGSK